MLSVVRYVIFIFLRQRTNSRLIGADEEWRVLWRPRAETYWAVGCTMLAAAAAAGRMVIHTPINQWSSLNVRRRACTLNASRLPWTDSDHYRWRTHRLVHP